MKKTWVLLGILLALPSVLAAGTLLGDVWQKILYIGGLGFLNIGAEAAVVAFTRLLIWILIFTVFFAVITSFGKKADNALGFLNRGQAGVVAAVIATIAAIFMPADVLLATGTSWATAIALILIGGPVVGLAFLLWKFPGPGQETKATVTLKIILCLLLLWILTAVKYHVGRIA